MSGKRDISISSETAFKRQASICFHDFHESSLKSFIFFPLDADMPNVWLRAL